MRCLPTDATGKPQSAVSAVVQPEKSRNVQLYSRETYARASEAAHCRVHATLMLPLFEDSARSSIIGVLEVSQSHMTHLSGTFLVPKYLQLFHVKHSASNSSSRAVALAAILHH